MDRLNSNLRRYFLHSRSNAASGVRRLGMSRLRQLRAGLVVIVLLAVVAAVRLNAAGSGSLDRHFAPTAVPDRIILTFVENPATSIAVSWRTDTTVSTPLVQITTGTASPDLEASAYKIRGTSRPLHAGNGLAHHHTATLSGLEPATQYAYRVGGGEVWSEWFHYSTASAEPEPFSFIYFGDAQNDIRSLWSRAIREAFREAPTASFMIHSGDLVNLRGGNHDTEWGEWFGAGHWLNAMIPSIPAAGNHEYVKANVEDLYVGLSPHWNHQFALPIDEVAEGLEGTVYHVDYQGVRVIVLNSLHALEFGSTAEQAGWLESRLRDNPNRWTIVTYHHPMFSTRDGRDNPELRVHWKPLFERYGVDLVLQGHDHAYGRGDNLDAGARAGSAGGPIYVVSVSGPKMYELGPNSSWADRRAENTQLYQVIHIDADRLRFEARTVAGQSYDSFELVKQANGRSMLVEPTTWTGEDRL